MAKYLESSGYSDAFFHVKEENEETDETTEKIAFPITRYEAVINRPKMVTNISETPISDFFLLITHETEVSDDTLYEMFGQTW